MINKRPYPGLKIERWTFLNRAEHTKMQRGWICKCDCGVVKAVEAGSILYGRSSSCGCYNKQVAKARALTHGYYGKREYHIWSCMKQRCTNPRKINFKLYGARGISICQRWEIFENFIEDMGPAPTARHSLDRIDNTKGYTKKNCRWSTSREQNNNRRNNRIVHYKGQSYTLAQLCRIKGHSYATILKRLSLGWAINTAVETPILTKRDRVTNKAG